MMTKARSAHFIFEKGIQYRDLAKIYPEIFRTFLQETEQMPEDNALVEIWLERDMKEIRKNEKPEGYLKQNSTKLVFPIRDDYVEFYIYNTSRNQAIPKIAEKLERIIKKAGLKHTLKMDAMLRFSPSK